MDSAWSQIEDFSMKISGAKDLVSLRQLSDSLEQFSNEYLEAYDNVVTFLVRTNTLESVSELLYQEERQKRCCAIIENFKKQLRDARLEITETMSTSSTSRYSTKSSTTTSLLVRKRMKADAQRAQLKFVQQEVELQRQKAAIDENELKLKAESERKKAELEANLVLLKHERDTAVLEAELKVIETHDTQSSRSVSPVLSNISQPVDRNELTAQYINTQLCNDIEQNVNIHEPEEVHDHEQVVGTTVIQPKKEHRVIDSPFNPIANSLERQANVSPLNPNVKSFAPALAPDQQHVVSNLTQFLLKKDLLLSRFTKFNDRPEAFAMWKASFTSITKELDVSAFEELDLLVKWLGPESAKYAYSIRAANTGNPERGLKRLWDRLEERFGSAELVESALKTKLKDFPRLSLKDNKKLYELVDILSEIEATKENPKYAALLSYFDSSSGILPIINKLPYSIQQKWTTRAFSYKSRTGAAYPPFSYFVEFMQEISKVRNDPGFQYESSIPQPRRGRDTTAITVRKTELSQQDAARELGSHRRSTIQKCPIHNTNHPLRKCRGFKAKTISERKKILRGAGICFRCCNATDHMARDCKVNLKCVACGSDNHDSLLHVDVSALSSSTREHGGEKDSTSFNGINSKCTQVCSDSYSGKSCAKTVLVRIYPGGFREQAIKAYVIIDDQSNRSLARSSFFDIMGINTELKQYTLSSCSGVVNSSGRRATGYIVEALDGSKCLKLPTLIECDEIPNVREEIPTPDVVRHHSHLHDLLPFIPEVDDNAQILLLIGRDLVEAHYVLDQRIGKCSPYAQKLALGWVVIGEACLHKIHAPDVINVNKTHLLGNGRTSVLKPCTNNFNIKESLELYGDLETTLSKSDDVFRKTPNDDKPGLSVEDREFLGIMDKSFVKDQDGGWIAPLPFRTPRTMLPNNRAMALKRAMILNKTLRNNPSKREHFFSFMQGIFDSNHAELAPPVSGDREVWYLPIFGVYHPRKPSKLRTVFDSSCKFEGVSLNDVLLTGPDLANSLLGVLLRFRKEQVAVMADIEQMFFCFLVTEEHRDFLRFLWHRNNDPNDDFVEYRMRKHVFGNTSSPAIATYGLRRSVDCVSNVDMDVQQFVHRNFYVDDALTSVPTPGEAIDLLKRTQTTLQEGGNIRLHKIASNCQDVVYAFPKDDRSADLKNIDLNVDSIPFQHSLGLTWDLQADCFTFRVTLGEKPFTRRGILSTLHSVYDPLGLIAPVILQGRLLFRELISMSSNWDDPLPPEFHRQWQSWQEGLQDLVTLKIPRAIVPISLQDNHLQELHVYSDASENAIASVAYLRITVNNDVQHVGFLLGKTKIAPKHGNTIPRLELCSAVLATEIAEVVQDQLDMTFDSVYFYTDSRVVMGYIYNRTRRFYTYVSNRIDRILKVSCPEQWVYVPSEKNPADVGTRCLSAKDMQHSVWLSGPAYIKSRERSKGEQFELIYPEQDVEVRPVITALKSEVNGSASIGISRFEKFSSWMKLIVALTRLRQMAKRKSFCIDIGVGSKSLDLYRSTELFVIRRVQRDVFPTEFLRLEKGEALSKDSPLFTLNAFVDANGVLRVGGRLSRSALSADQKHPIIIPKRTHIATLLVRHFHEKVHHQGRSITEGMLRSSGYWIISAKRLISSLLYKCVTCRKLRGKFQSQIMADLPDCRVTPSPPFTYVGLDTFGHWNIVTRKTRGGSVNSKRWAILFTCMNTRAVHIEVIEEMSTSSFINALRRFMSIRGSVKEFRSDRGSNFVGSTDCLRVDAINVEDQYVAQFLFESGTKWIFNPPHASHFGGVWERMIGVARRILDAIMIQSPAKHLTHEVLVTFMAEVCSVINSRPIVPVSADPETPVLSPSMILTQKVEGEVAPFQEFDIRDVYRAQWKQVQVLSDLFWKRWRVEYLNMLQSRRKWQDVKDNIKQGDIVLLREKNLHRNEWPIGIVENSITSKDGKVRTVELRIVKNGQISHFVRPICEVVLLCSPQ